MYTVFVVLAAPPDLHTLCCCSDQATTFLPTPSRMSLAKRNSEAAAKWAAKRRESKERAVILQEQARAAAAIPRQRPISSQNDEPPPRFGASTSHVDNAKYMDDFREGLANMRLALEGPGGAGDDELGVPNERRIPNERRDRSSYPSAPHGCRNSSSSSTTLTRCSSQHGESAPDRIRHRQSEQQRGGFGKVRSGAGLLAEELHRYVNGDAAVGGWREGPLDPAGNVSYAFWTCMCGRAGNFKVVFQPFHV